MQSLFIAGEEEAQMASSPQMILDNNRDKNIGLITLFLLLYVRTYFCSATSHN